MTVNLSDYTVAPFSIMKTELDFDLHPDRTRVKSCLTMKRVTPGANAVVLHGEKLTLERVVVNGVELKGGEFELDDKSLTLKGLGDENLVEITTLIVPSENTELTGLYMSGGRFCTQCEAEGFRRITYYLDRPDCLSVFHVRLEADKADYPTLLSNGDQKDAGALEGGRHYATFEDPFLKPAYLFALVAGQFDTIEDHFETRSGKPVRLAIHVDPGQAERARFAMDALKRSMKWDEEVFKREYDLSVFHIVAVRDFNYGAMENKGLNVFNSSLLLADSASATDADFLNVERVIAHEYFHNWTGNRITLRDWFQLCLKEGLTVYRDQEFSSDNRIRSVQRISDVESLRAVQFPEDAGPLSHPPRPSSYETIDNFYTPTVYKKGAEVVRLIRELAGEERFDTGMQVYFDRCDGTAATLEDFVGSFEFPDPDAAAGAMRWYEQAGTPVLNVSIEYDTQSKRAALTVSQASTAGGGGLRPIPLRVGFISEQGHSLSARLAGAGAPADEHRLVLKQSSETFNFESLAERPIPAILRGFNAPVRVARHLSDDDLLVQMTHDPDPFTRWDAGQTLLADAIMAAADGHAQSGPSLERVAAGLEQEFERDGFEPGFVARVIRPPSVSDLIFMTDMPDPEALYDAQAEARRTLADALQDHAEAEFAKPAPAPKALDNEAIGRRALRSAFLALTAARGEAGEARLSNAYAGAGNMTEAMAALHGLSEVGGAAFQKALDAFETRWSEDPLVMDKWFSVQAASAHEGYARIQTLKDHPQFTLKNPNRARSLYGPFAAANPRQFHAADGSGYELLADAILALDAYNPMTAARLIRSFEAWKRFDDDRQEKAKSALTRIKGEARSTNLKEMVDRTLS